MHAVVTAVNVSVTPLRPVVNKSTVAAVAPDIWAMPSQKRVRMGRCYPG